ncbi:MULTISPECIES: hypothetical protein [unclassified Streptomyces]|uniref:hypothetical protein n=1 Tax=unclassified Streptomyces TaxID=2593676 RepID=UPI003803EF10
MSDDRETPAPHDAAPAQPPVPPPDDTPDDRTRAFRRSPAEPQPAAPEPVGPAAEGVSPAGPVEGVPTRELGAAEPVGPAVENVPPAGAVDGVPAQGFGAAEPQAPAPADNPWAPPVPGAGRPAGPVEAVPVREFGAGEPQAAAQVGNPWAPPVPGAGQPAVPQSGPWGYPLAAAPAQAQGAGDPWAPPPIPQAPGVEMTKRPVPADAPAPQAPTQPYPYGPWGAVPPQGQYPGYPGYPGYADYPGYPGHPAYPGGPYGAWGQPAPRNGFGVTAMVLGIIGSILGIACFGAFLGLPLGLAALVFGIVGLRIVRRGEATNRGQALTGLILGIVSVVVSGAMIALVVGGIAGGWFDTMDDELISADQGAYGTPMAAGSPVTYDDGVVVTVSAAHAAGGAPADAVSDGTAVTFTVTVENTGDQTADMEDSEANAYAEEEDDDTLEDVTRGRGLPSELRSGATVTSDVTVIVPDDDPDGRFQVEIAPGYDYDYTYWELPLP